MTNLTATPADLRPGDRIVQPDGDPEDWPRIDAVGDARDNDAGAPVVPVTIDGEDAPRELPQQTGIAVWRDDS